MSKQRLQQQKEFSLTRQQIQFLNLLQVSIVELEKRIEEELEENPVLEEDDEDDHDDHDALFSNNSLGGFSEKKPDFSAINLEDKNNTLAGHLNNQLIGINLNEELTFLLNYLINSLDDSGFLTRNIYSISSDLLANEQLDISEKNIKKALEILQSLDPCGVGAKNLQECLALQLKKLYPKEKKAREIIKHYYAPFSNKNFEYLSKKLNLSSLELKNIYSIIESLNPIPSIGFSKNTITTEYIYPDFNVFIKDGSPILQINNSKIKKLKISSFYKKLLQENPEKETKAFLKQKIDSANWFTEALLKRESTLKNVVSSIINIQKNYFVSGNEKDLIPMKLSDIASLVLLKWTYQPFLE